MAFLLLPKHRGSLPFPLNRASHPFFASHASLSVSFFGAVLYLFLLQPWGFPLLVTGKGATSCDLGFHHQPEQEKAKHAQGFCKLLLRTEHLRADLEFFHGRLHSTVEGKLVREKGASFQGQCCRRTCILSHPVMRNLSRQNV